MKKQLENECKILLLSFLVLLISIQFWPASSTGKTVSMNGKDTVAVYTRDSILFTNGILSSLKAGETFQIWYHSSGCFHSYGNKLEITRSTEAYTAKLYKWEPSTNEMLLHIYRPGKLLRSVVLDTAQVQTFNAFESDLSVLRGGSRSTTQQNFTFFTRHLNLSMNGCYDENKGFEKLLEKFFHN